MKIVIDIPKEVFDRFCRCTRFPDEVEEAIIAIVDGTILPKGHGRLIDADALNEAVEAIEQIRCLTDRPCEVCRFKTENGCNRWECVFKGV